MELYAWREKLAPYELAVEELTIKFRRMISDYRAAGGYSPIEQVTGRVKTISSMLDKAHRKGGSRRISRWWATTALSAASTPCPG